MRRRLRCFVACGALLLSVRPARAAIEPDLRAGAEALAACRRPERAQAKPSCYARAVKLFEAYGRTRGAPASVLHGRRTGTAVVLIHSYTASPREMDYYALSLGQAGYNVISLVLEGHGVRGVQGGGARSLGGVRPEEWFDDAAFGVGVAQALGDRVIVFGYSLGGTLALRQALTRPESVDGVIALAPMLGVGQAVFGEGGLACLGRAAADSVLADAAGLSRDKKEFLRGACALIAVGESVNPVLLKVHRIRESRRLSGGDVGAGLLMASDAALAAERGAFQRMRVPYLLIGSEGDDTVDYDTLLRFLDASASTGRGVLFTGPGAPAHQSYVPFVRNKEGASIDDAVRAFVKGPP